MAPYRSRYRSSYRYGMRLKPGCIPGGRATVEWEKETEDGQTLLYRVEGTVTDYDPGVTSGPVDRCYPPEGGEVEIEEVYQIDEDGNEQEVSQDIFSSEEIRDIEQLLAENVEPPEPPEPDPYDDW